MAQGFLFFYKKVLTHYRDYGSIIDVRDIVLLKEDDYYDKRETYFKDDGQSK